MTAGGSPVTALVVASDGLYHGAVPRHVDWLHDEAAASFEEGRRRDLDLVAERGIRLLEGIEDPAEVRHDGLDGLPRHEVDVHDDGAEVGDVRRLDQDVALPAAPDDAADVEARQGGKLRVRPVREPDVLERSYDVGHLDDRADRLLDLAEVAGHAVGVDREVDDPRHAR